LRSELIGTTTPDHEEPIVAPPDDYAVAVDTPTADLVIPRCDLVQKSHVYMIKSADPDSSTMSLKYKWEKNETNYESIGAFNHYVIRHGPFDMEMLISESNARYAIIFSDAIEFVLDEIPIGDHYVIQMCAVKSDDPGYDLDKSFDWRNKARINTLYLPSDEENWFNFEGTIEKAHDDGFTDDFNQQEVPEQGGDSQETLMGVDEPISISKIQLNNSYAVLLLVLVIIGVLSIVIGCVWLCLARKRRNAKLEAFAPELPVKEKDLA
jgi:hypothetical protein